MQSTISHKRRRITWFSQYILWYNTLSASVLARVLLKGCIYLMEANTPSFLTPIHYQVCAFIPGTLLQPGNGEEVEKNILFPCFCFQPFKSSIIDENSLQNEKKRKKNLELVQVQYFNTSVSSPEGKGFVVTVPFKTCWTKEGDRTQRRKNIFRSVGG